MKNKQGYDSDLAYIHDVGFSDFSTNASKFVLDILKINDILGGEIVELGCGSGNLAQILTANGVGYQGIDLSPEMLELAQRKVPEAKFIQGSVWTVDIPPCNVVLSIGEVFNYEFEGTITERQLQQLFSRVYAALKPKGIFIFDILCTGEPQSNLTKNFTEGEDWLVAVERKETFHQVTRRIISFREVENGYRKTIETHRVRKHDVKLIIQLLEECGFNVQVQDRYGVEILRNEHKVYVAFK